ncbi:MAG: hypothetical protein MI976_07035 [Pseudomonadales bacterium]|nr:hypothetical protein [Pseudomonadales bacterium]
MDQQQQQTQNQSQTQAVNIRVASSDPQLEQRIFTRVASAGRQLARMADVMSLLIDQFESMPDASLTEKQQDTIEKFRAMCVNIKKEKAQHSAEYILQQLDRLQASDAAEYERLVVKLKARLDLT